MTNPVPGFSVTYPYGVKNPSYAAGFHTGDDYACPIGTQVVAPADSKIVYAGWGSGGWGDPYGNQVIGETKHKGRTIRWATNHMSHVGVSTGDHVKAGDKIGKSGDTGNVTGPHVHFEERFTPFRYNDVCHEPVLADTDPDGPDSKWAEGEIYMTKLKKGQKDSDSVRRLQYRLVNHNHVPAKDVKINGHYDAGTVKAVMYWQRQVADAEGLRDGSRVTLAQARRLFGENFKVLDQ